jgi:hypothetical protein
VEAMKSVHEFLSNMFREDTFADKFATFALLKGIDNTHLLLPEIKILLRDGTEIKNADQLRKYIEDHTEYLQKSRWPFTLNVSSLDTIEAQGSKSFFLVWTKYKYRGKKCSEKIIKAPVSGDQIR